MDAEGAAVGTEADPIPVIIDQNTAMWSLQMMGAGIRASNMNPESPSIFASGLLANSVLQGNDDWRGKF